MNHVLVRQIAAGAAHLSMTYRESLQLCMPSTSSFNTDGVREVNPMVVTNDLHSMPAQVCTDSPDFLMSTLLLN